jgi:hypothetical protein
MKKIAVTVAVLALGLAACAKNNADNTAANDLGTENAATADMNGATNDTTNAASNALDQASNNLAVASNAVENATAAVNNASSNK